MTGSLQIKNEKYYVVLNIRENGKRKQKWIATGLSEKGNKRKAEQILRETLHEYESAAPLVATSNMLFSDYIRQWLKIAQRRVDAVTYQGYEVMTNAQILPYFDNLRVKLCDVTHNVLQVFFDEKSTSGRKDGKGGLSPSSLRQYKNIINQTLNEAVKNGLIHSNPCQFVELPQKIRHEANFYTAEQLKALFAAAKDDPLYLLIKITALYGLRRSEVLGLKWDCVDFENKRVTIRRTVSKVTKTVEKEKTKNNASRRSFPMTPEAEDVFRAAKAADDVNRRLCGKDYHGSGYVFTWPDGTPFSPDYVTRHFSVLLKNANLPSIRFHDLRHSCASLLLNNGYTLKDVQEYMGHADIQMTANIYGHLDSARKQSLADNISEKLFESC